MNLMARKIANTVKQTQRRGSETRIRLLNAAREQFASQGYDGASLRMIAASADITLALLHYHFGSKRDLYRAVWVEQYSSEAEQTRRSVYADVTPQDSREAALRRVIGGSGTDAASRLGLTADTPGDGPRAAFAAAQRWRRRADHPLNDPFTTRACRAAVRSAEALVAMYAAGG